MNLFWIRKELYWRDKQLGIGGQGDSEELTVIFGQTRFGQILFLRKKAPENGSTFFQ